MDPGEALSEGYMCLEDFPVPSKWLINYEKIEKEFALQDAQLALERKNSLGQETGKKQNPNEIVF
jgi:hypothetical protein